MGLNWIQVNRLVSLERSGGSEGLFEETIKSFCETIESERCRLASLILTENFSEASKLAGAMKLSSKKVGAEELVDSLQYIEDFGAGLVERGSFDRVAALEDLNRSLESAVSELEELIR